MEPLSPRTLEIRPLSDAVASFASEEPVEDRHCGAEPWLGVSHLGGKGGSGQWS